YAAHQEPAADDLAERRENGPNVEALLGPAPRGPERDQLVEDQHNIMPLGNLTQPRQEPLGRRQEAGIAHHRIDDQTRELTPRPPGSPHRRPRRSTEAPRRA